ncbi:MAG: RagB/SusD family nutrient uptake outer membrane protein [Bacteroidaceae bacterium]|nr:RagB/SusD family nutrient uptake outer membrane protein [Bacteroidaceae bacterium]
MKTIKYIAAAAVLGWSLTSCEDFLNRPVEDNYVASGYYNTAEQCKSAVNYLYNSPWYDFQRGFFKVGEVLSGNFYWGSSPYLNFSLTSNDEDLRNMAYSLWSVNSHCNMVRESIHNGGAPAEAKEIYEGECLLWKAMAYFYLVRTFGDVPIVHSTLSMLESGDYNSVKKVRKADVYEYIVMTLEKAIEYLPESCETGRLDKYCAKALMAKVYLTKAGLSGQLDPNDLQKAFDYALDVKNNSGRQLAANYADCFKLTGNNNPENMIAWRWTVSKDWTSQNTFQSDLAMAGMDEFGDCWGGYNGPSVDLQAAFGLTPVDNPSTRSDIDTRRKATYMTAGDVVPYLWADHGGFDFLKFVYKDSKYDPKGFGPGELQSATGANCVKHLYGNNADHEAAGLGSAGRMSSSLCTPILRLADVYLVLAEAKVLLGQGTDSEALAAFNAVHQRAVPTAAAKTSLTFDDVWKERRLELALEGDRWYDFVRRAYYNPEACVAEITAQKRNMWWELNSVFGNYYKTNIWSKVIDDAGHTAEYDTETPVPNVNITSFTIPFPQEDLTFNPNLANDVEPISVDVRATYQY